jgi:hypothetical protein
VIVHNDCPIRISCGREEFSVKLVKTWGRLNFCVWHFLRLNAHDNNANYVTKNSIAMYKSLKPYTRFEPTVRSFVPPHWWNMMSRRHHPLPKPWVLDLRPSACFVDNIL